VRERQPSNVVARIRALVMATQVRDLPDQDLLDRFVRDQDEAAFAALVDRHAAMVLGVCRRVLKHAHDAEDAFQATFLVLARQAGSIRNPESLGGWLQRVAHHVALKARTGLARRSAREVASVEAAEVERPATPEPTWREALLALDEEMSRLPASYRAALVLCYLEGRTQDEAAGQLGWSLGTLRGRLERARQQLRQRLSRRGVVLSAALLGAGLASSPTSAGLALAVTKATQATTCVTPRVTALAEGVSRAMLPTRVKVAAILVLSLSALAVAAGVTCMPVETVKSLTPGVVAPDQPKAKDEKQTRTDRHGDSLPPEAIARLGTVRFRSGSFDAGLMFAPDGKVLVSHGGSGAVCLWEVSTGREVGRIAGAPGTLIRSAALSPDGKVLATVAGPVSGMVGDVPIQLWDRATCRSVRHLGKGPYAAVSFSPDGSTLAAVRFDSRVDLWDVRAGRLLRGWQAHGHATIIAWRPDDHLAWTARFTAHGKTLVTAHPLEGVRFWDVKSGARVSELSLLSQPDAVAISPDGSVLAVGKRPAVYTGKATEQSHGRIHLIDPATGKASRQLIAAGQGLFGARLGVRSVAFSSDGKMLAACGADGYFRLWDVASGRELHRWWISASVPRALAFSPDGKTLAVASAGAIRLLDTASGKEVGPPLHNASLHTPVAFSRDGRTAITAALSAPLLWDASTGRLRHQLGGHGEQAFVMGLTVVGNSLFSWADNRTPQAWDIATSRKVACASALAGKELRSVVASPDGKTLAVLFHTFALPAREEVVLVDASSGKEVRRLTGHAGGVSGTAFPRAGQTLVTWGGDGMVRVWDLGTGRQLRQITLVEDEAPPGRVMPPGGAISLGRFYSATLSSDGRLFAYGSRQRFLVVYDLATGKVVRRLDRLPDVVGPMVFTPDGRTLVWAGEVDPTVGLVEVATGKERHRLTGHRGRVWSLAVSPDGRRLLSGSVDTTALVWDLAGSLGGQLGPRTREEREACWADLASADPARAYRAVRRLASAPASLRGRLAPIDPVDEKGLERLIRDLDVDDFARRQMASDKLETLGERAAAACRAALRGKPSLEMQKRLQRLADRQMQAWWADTPERRRMVRGVEALELAGTPEARQELRKLAGGAAGVRLTEEARAALRRLEAALP
jgi:RNA polymerase sigma factor (sigma-70 family)